MLTKCLLGAEKGTTAIVLKTHDSSKDHRKWNPASRTPLFQLYDIASTPTRCITWMHSISLAHNCRIAAIHDSVILASCDIVAGTLVIVIERSVGFTRERPPQGQRFSLREFLCSRSPQVSNSCVTTRISRLRSPISYTVSVCHD